MHVIKHQGGGSCMAMRMPVRPSGRPGGYRPMGGAALHGECCSAEGGLPVCLMRGTA